MENISLYFLVTGLLATLLVTPAASQAKAGDTIDTWMSNPLIIGASVSADYASPSPGKKLALRYTKAEKIKTIAFGGRPGVQILQSLKDGELKNRSIIVAIDLFFWDSTLPSVNQSLAALDRLVEQSRKLGIPLVLGEIPNLLPGHQPNRVTLNDALRKRCFENKNCYLMPFEKLHRQVVADGFLEIKGRKYRLFELVPDGLHLNDVAAEELADRMLDLLKSREKI